MKDSDLIRRSDATEVVCRYADSVDPTHTFSGVLRLTLRDLPAVDAVEVVRCRECKHNAQPPDKGFAQCELDALIREPEFWCRAGARMDGQRREDGDNDDR